MTTPALALPPLLVNGTTSQPHTGGLYGVAAVKNLGEPARLAGGVSTTPYSGGAGHGVWPAVCEPVPADLVKAGGRPDDIWAPPVTVWAADECSLIGSTEQEEKARAEHTLSLFEPVDVEAELVPRLLAEAGTPGAAAAVEPFVAAVGAIEEALGVTGVAGVIHARRGLAAVAVRYGLAVAGPVGTLVTPLGTRWAFGGGYSALGNVLVGTGPVTVHRSPVAVTVGLGQRRNERLAVAEREVVVSWEIVTVAATAA